MKTLEMEQMGVQEMDAMELNETEGGWLFPYWRVGFEVIYGSLYSGPRDIPDWARVS